MEKGHRGLRPEHKVDAKDKRRERKRKRKRERESRVMVTAMLRGMDLCIFV